MDDDLDYERDIKIDPDALDVEWLRQPELFIKYSKACTEAERIAKRAIQAEKVCRSELIMEAWKDPSVMGEGMKANAQTVEAYYRSHDDHQNAKRKSIKMDHEWEVMKSAVFAFHQRKVALENMVRLLGQEYFAAPSAPRDVGAEYLKGTSHSRATDKVKKHKKSGRG